MVKILSRQMMTVITKSDEEETNDILDNIYLSKYSL